MPDLPAKTPEQIAQIKRLAPPIALAALVLGILGEILLLRTTVDATHPPSVTGVAMTQCAMLMGIGILVWAKGSGVVRTSMWLCLAALLIGTPGMFIYLKGGVDLRIKWEERELANVSTIAKAAEEYARKHEGRFPSTVKGLIIEHYVAHDEAISPFGSDEIAELLKLRAQGKITQQDYDAWFATHSDYDLFTYDLTLAPMTTATAPRGHILVAAAHHPVMRTRLAVAFDDGSSRFISLEEAEDVLRANNQARIKLGLPTMAPPDAIQRARDMEHRANPTPSN